MRWYIPSWNGDFRLEPNGDGTRLTIHKPTASEIEELTKIHEILVSRGLTEAKSLWQSKPWYRMQRAVQTVDFSAPFHELVPIFARGLRHGREKLHAILMKNGEVRVVTEVDDITDDISVALYEKLRERSVVGKVDQQDIAEKEAKAAEEVREQKLKEEVKAVEKDAKAAATVKRPTICCPRCLPGSIDPAREVLLEFLTDDQHEQWAEHRCIEVTGNITGKRYLLAHRNTDLAARWGKICFAVDDHVVMHFHDRSVPPEEEILAAKLILENREDWLRCYGTGIGIDRGAFNPFGKGGGDGIDSTRVTVRLGYTLEAMDR